MPKPRPTHPVASGSSAKPRNGWEAARDGDVESIRRLAQAGDPSLWQPGTEGEFTGWRAVDVAVQDNCPESIEALWQTGLPGVRSTFSTHGPRNHLLPAHLAAKLGTLNALMVLAEIPEVRDTLFKLFSDGIEMKCAMHFAVERGPGPVEQLVRTGVPQVLTFFYRRAPCGTAPPASFADDAGPTRRIVESALARAIEQASGSIAKNLSSVLHGIGRYASPGILATARLPATGARAAGFPACPRPPRMAFMHRGPCPPARRAEPLRQAAAWPCERRAAPTALAIKLFAYPLSVSAP